MSGYVRKHERLQQVVREVESWPLYMRTLSKAGVEAGQKIRTTRRNPHCWHLRECNDCGPERAAGGGSDAA